MISIIFNPVHFTLMPNSHELDAFKTTEFNALLLLKYPKLTFKFSDFRGKNGCEFPKKQKKNSCE